MDARRKDLGFEENVLVEDIALYDHLSPRLQTLPYEARNFKNEKGFKFYWARPGEALYSYANVIKLARIDDLHALVQDGMEAATSRG